MKNILLVFLLILSPNLVVFGQEVVLIRHAAVQLERPGWMTSREAAGFRESYDTAPVYPFDPDTVLAKIPKRRTDTVYVSGLSRSVTTGKILFGDSANIVSLDMLNEFEMHVVRLPAYLPYKGWTFLSRSMWLMGAEKQGTESYKEARERVKRVADFIEEKVLLQNQVILVTHGFINRNIAKELEKRAWVISRNNGRKNLGATVLIK